MKNYVCTEVLEKKIRKKFPTDGDYVSFIRKYRLTGVMVNTLKDLDEKLNKEIVEHQNRQKMKYDVFCLEIEKLTKHAKNHGIKLLILKGIVLANDLYNPYYLRGSDDIDLYVDYSDLEKMDNILREFGYYVNNEDTYTNTIKYVTKYKSIRDELTHLAQYHKDFMINGKKETIDLELHIHFCHYLPNFSLESQESIFTHAKEIKIPQIIESIYTLDLNDTIIHLCAHHVRHFYWQYYIFMRNNTHFEVRIDLLHEIAMYIEKHWNEIDWNELMERSIVLNQFEILYFVIKVLHEIYERIDLDLMRKFYEKYNELVKKLDNGLSSRFVNAMITLNYNELIFKSYYELIEIVSNKFQEQMKEFKIYTNETRKTSLNFKCYAFNKNLTQINQKDILMQSTGYMNAKSFNANCFVYYDNDYIYTDIIIPNVNNLENYTLSKLVFSISRSECHSFYDEFEQRNLGDKFFSKNMVTMLIDVKKQNSERLEVRIGKDKTIYLDSSFLLIDSKDNLVNIVYKISWKKLGLKPDFNRVVNYLCFVDYECQTEHEIATIRYSTNYGGKYDYCLYYPWYSELLKLRII